MNCKRFISAAIVLFIFIFIFETLVHGFLLAGMYGETPTIWRSQEQMMHFVPFNLAIMVLLTIWITFIFTQIYKEGGWKNGLLFGFYFGILSGIQAAGAYYYLPISAILVGSWFVANVVECLIGGVLIGLIYRK